MVQCWFDSYRLMIFLLMVATTKCKQCNVLRNTDAVLNSVATLTCPLTQVLEGTQVTWEVLQGERAEEVHSLTNCSNSCTREANNNRAQQPLCKMRAMQDLQNRTGSLIISPVEVTDGLWYRCIVWDSNRSHCFDQKITVKDEPQLQTSIDECNITSPTEAVLNSTLMLQCPVAQSHHGTPQVIWGTVDGVVPVPVTRCPLHCTSSGTQKPLCERAKTMENGSLSISAVESTDLLWFWCALTTNSMSCYRFKLTAESVSHATQSPQERTHGSNGTVVGSNATVVMFTSATSIFLFVAVLLGVYICFRKQKKKQKVETENPYENFEDILHNDTGGYSLVHFGSAILQNL